MQANNELTTKEKARIMRNKYARDWRKKNPDKVKEAMERHYSKKYDEMMAAESEDGDGDGNR